MNNYDTMLAGLKDLVDNPTPRVPVVLCLDVSGSMSGVPIRELNAGVGQYLSEMQSDELTRYSVETALVTFSTGAECVADFEMADRIQAPELKANGITCMGEGVELSLNLLEQRKTAYKATGVDYYQPILVLMSDGALTAGIAWVEELLRDYDADKGSMKDLAEKVVTAARKRQDSLREDDITAVALHIHRVNR